MRDTAKGKRERDKVVRESEMKVMVEEEEAWDEEKIAVDASNDESMVERERETLKREAAANISITLCACACERRWSRE